MSQPYLAHRSFRETSEPWPGTDEAVAAGFQAPAMRSVNMWLINDSRFFLICTFALAVIIHRVVLVDISIQTSFYTNNVYFLLKLINL